MTKAAFIFDLGGSECVTTLDVEHVGVSEGDACTLLTIFMVDAWVPHMAVTSTFVETRLGDSVVASGSAGEGEPNALPANCALIMQKNTGTSVRGRFFLPGLAETNVDPGGRVGIALRDLVDASFASALSALIAANVIPKVASGSGVGGSLTNITSITSRPLIATLRNRIVTR